MIDGHHQGGNNERSRGENDFLAMCCLFVVSNIALIPISFGNGLAPLIVSLVAPFLLVFCLFKVRERSYYKLLSSGVGGMVRSGRPISNAQHEKAAMYVNHGFSLGAAEVATLNGKPMGPPHLPLYRAADHTVVLVDNSSDMLCTALSDGRLLVTATSRLAANDRLLLNRVTGNDPEESLRSHAFARDSLVRAGAIVIPITPTQAALLIGELYAEVVRAHPLGKHPRNEGNDFSRYTVETAA